ncbi:MAG TPA: alanine--tRNA ligase [Humisphaera sp.]|nr:alanine--tRNA ligase [Humisphaera sp.]
MVRPYDAMTSQQIRQQFIDFFVQKHGHTFVPSSPVVPHDDPTLLFTNAGMNQFKPYFLGQEKAPWPRVANTQKCIRAGGKHNDLDDVGRSRRHHTFFEMLGNWSFGDYFKQGAIEMAWELLTKVWKLDPTRLHVTCYEGNESAGVPRDTQAADIWKQVAGLPDDHIHYFGKDNFWEMGDTGPCGPCTEIYVDRTPEKTGGKDVNGQDPRVMEIWNLVFIQYNRDAAGKLTTLPSQHVDTGMGFERICQVMQGKDDNYAIDLWTPLFDRISEISSLKYTGKFPKTNAADPVAEAADPQLRHDIAFRVIADHVRCLTFALTDGAVPSNEGRGYVLRRILRRAVRFGRQQLGLSESFLHKLVPVIVESMGDAFPELRKDPRRVSDLIQSEELSFGRTLDRGIQLFDEAYRRAVYVASPRIVGYYEPAPNHNEEVRRAVTSWENRTAPRAGMPTISAEDAFKLHDTYGFPIDLTRIMAEERGMTVDVAGYEVLMENARDLARSGGKSSGLERLAELPPSALAALAEAKVPPTDDSPKFERLKPNTKSSGELVSNDLVWMYGRVMAIWNGTDLGLSPASATDDEELAVISDKTCFYAEMGGQVGDRGHLSLAPSGAGFDVETTRKAGPYILHIGRVRKGTLKVGESFTAFVDGSRHQTEQNHTSTHIANWALREVLGDDVQQKGSLVDPEKLRFDFSHSKAMSDDELARVETLVNESIARKMPVYAQVAPQAQALKINGLRAVFGEKYPPMVRVVSIGAPVEDLLADPANPKWRQFSIEFCGGTHLQNSGDARTFAITAEESVSKGIRRIVALTGDAAEQAAAAGREIDALIAKGKAAQDSELPGVIAALQKAITGTIPLRAKRRGQAAIADLQARHKAFEKAAKLQPASKIDIGAISSNLLESAAALGSSKLIVSALPEMPTDQLLAVTDSLKKKAGSFAAFLASAVEGKVNFVAAVSDDLVAKGFKAGDWLKESAKAAGGAGGGRPQLAQGSGKDPAKIEDALAVAREVARRIIS